jgi:hypothetical protein
LYVIRTVVTNTSADPVQEETAVIEGQGPLARDGDAVLRLACIDVGLEVVARGDCEGAAADVCGVRRRKGNVRVHVVGNAVGATHVAVPGLQADEAVVQRNDGPVAGAGAGDVAADHRVDLLVPGGQRRLPDADVEVRLVENREHRHDGRDFRR